MENKQIIIILSIIVVVMIALAFFMFGSSFAKTDSKVDITSNSSLNKEDSLTIHLTDLNGKPITNQAVNITIIGADGVENKKTVITDANGDASLQLNEFNSGNYTVKVNYGGNENFSSCNTTQNLEIKEQSVSSQSSNSDAIYYDSELNLYYNSDGIIVNPDGKHPMHEGESYYDVKNAPRDRN